MDAVLALPGPQSTSLQAQAAWGRPGRAAGTRCRMDGGGKAGRPSWPRPPGGPRPVPAGETVAPLYPLNPHWPRCPKPSCQGRCPHILSPSLALSPGLATSHSENREGGWGHRQGSTPRPLTPYCVSGTRAQPPPSASHSLGLADRSLPARTPSCLSPVSSPRWLQGAPGRVCHAP